MWIPSVCKHTHRDLPKPHQGPRLSPLQMEGTRRLGGNSSQIEFSGGLFKVERHVQHMTRQWCVLALQPPQADLSLSYGCFLEESLPYLTQRARHTCCTLIAVFQGHGDITLLKDLSATE